MHRLKWPNTEHRSTRHRLIGRDEAGTWCAVAAGTDTTTETRWAFSADHDAVLLLPDNEWWTIYWSTNGSIYIDITTPIKWTDPNNASTIDLDLDIYVNPNGDAEVLDVDEFRQRIPGYPPDLVRHAQSAMRLIVEDLVGSQEMLNTGRHFLANQQPSP